MVLASHVVFTVYGFWLPNDPRGSWSDFVRTWELYWFGPPTKVTTRRSLARDAHNQQLRRVAKSALRYAPVHLTGRQALSVARGFKRALTESGYVVYACAVLPEHAHAVVKRHDTRRSESWGTSRDALRSNSSLTGCTRSGTCARRAGRYRRCGRAGRGRCSWIR